MSKQRNAGILTLASALVALSTLAPAPASAQQSVDPRWTPWIGCWVPLNDPATNDLLCVRPGTQAEAVEVVRVSNLKVVSREVIWADDQHHETARGDCQGWEQGSFSQDGRRVFTTSDHSCENGAEQTGAGIMAIAANGEWLDIRVAGMGGQQMAWVQRYRAADDMQTEAAGFSDLLDQSWPTRAARLVASQPMDVDDVIEASEQVPAEAVKALLAERRDRLGLNSDAVVRMADNGVAPEVIDVAVAVSFPKTFHVASAAGEVERSALDQGSIRRRWAYQGDYMGSTFFDPFYAPWSLRYGYYGYDPYFYGRYGAYGGYGYGYGYGGTYWGYTPSVVVVEPTTRTHGRVINGRGYTRSRGSSAGGGGSRSVVPSRSGGGSSASPSSRSGGSSSGRTAKPRGGGGGSQQSVSSGSSSGSSSQPARRTAKPRGGGGLF